MELRQQGQLQGQGTIKQTAIDESRVLGQKHKEKYQLRSGTTVVAGDSILKGLKGWLMARDGSIKVHSFAGATTQDMQDYIKPLLSRKPSRIVLHTGTNDLLNELNAEQIADKIFELGRKIVNSGTSCTISTLVERQDELNSMVRDVNKFLIQNLPRELSIIDNSNLTASYHLNASGLHLNRKGDGALALNIIRHIKSHSLGNK